MQLTIEVLPAPLGPMIENSSPSRMVKLTSVSARTPPNRNDTPRTSNVVSTKTLPEKWRCRALALLAAIDVPILARPNRQDHATIDVSRRWHTRCQLRLLRPTSPLGERHQ